MARNPLPYTEQLAKHGLNKAKVMLDKAQSNFDKKIADAKAVVASLEAAKVSDLEAYKTALAAFTPAEQANEVIAEEQTEVVAEELVEANA